MQHAPGVVSSPQLPAHEQTKAFLVSWIFLLHGRTLRPVACALRGRFSASPATGLIGLQENQFLGDFFDCLGFLAIANQRSVSLFGQDATK